MPIFMHFGYILIDPKISQKRSFWGKNGPFLAPKSVRSVRHYFYLLLHKKIVQYPKFHPFSRSLSMISTLIPHCTWQLAPPPLSSPSETFSSMSLTSSDSSQICHDHHHKLPQVCLQYQTHSKHSQNTHKTLLKHSWNTLLNTLEATFKHWWNTNKILNTL